MIAAAISGLVAGYGIAMPAGAIAILLISISATTCFCMGVSAGLGAATIFVASVFAASASWQTLLAGGALIAGWWPAAAACWSPPWPRAC
jgi:hypothetical protein